MAVYYVSTTGSNANNGSSPEQAWATFAYALANAVTGSTIYVLSGMYTGITYLDLPNKTLSLIRLGEGNVVVETSYGNNGLRGTAGGTYVIEGFTLNGSKTGANFYVNNLTNLTLNQCTAINTYDGVNANCVLSLNGGNVTVNGGYYECPKTPIYLTDGDAQLNGPTIKCGAGAGGIKFGRYQAGRAEQNMVLDGVVFDGTPTSVAVYKVAGQYVNSVEIKNCTGRCGQLWKEDSYCRHFHCHHNNMTLTFNGTRIVSCGLEVAQNGVVETNPNPYTTVKINSNRFVFTAVAPNHFIFVGLGAAGVSRAEVIGNTLLFSGSTSVTIWGIVTKCPVLVLENKVYLVCSGDTVGIGCYGSEESYVRHNTVVASTYCLRLDVHQDYWDSGTTLGYPLTNSVRDNIFVSLSGIPYSIMTAAPEMTDGANLADYNLLWTGGTWIAAIGDQLLSKATLLANPGSLQATWAAWLGNQPGDTNDDHALCADPLLADPANGDFSIGFGSPAIKAASDGTTIGAWQRSGSPRLLGMGLQ